MEKERIEEIISEIPVTTLGKIPNQGEVWEYTEGGTHFKIARHRITMPEEPEPEVCLMTIYGEPTEKERIITEFSQVLGSPTKRTAEPGPDGSEQTESVAWLILDS